MRKLAAIGAMLAATSLMSLSYAAPGPTKPIAVATTGPFASAAEVAMRIEFQERWAWVDLLGDTYGYLGYHLAEEYSLPHWLVRSLIRVESEGNPSATSHTADHGLMQLNDVLWPSLAVELGLHNPDPYDPEQNLRMGMAHLSKLYGKYGDWTYALTAYNMGEAGLERHIHTSGTAESEYSRKVLQGRSAAPPHSGRGL